MVGDPIGVLLHVPLDVPLGVPLARLGLDLGSGLETCWDREWDLGLTPIQRTWDLLGLGQRMGLGLDSNQKQREF